MRIQERRALGGSPSKRAAWSRAFSPRKNSSWSSCDRSRKPHAIESSADSTAQASRRSSRDRPCSGSASVSLMMLRLQSSAGLPLPRRLGRPWGSSTPSAALCATRSSVAREADGGQSVSATTRSSLARMTRVAPVTWTCARPPRYPAVSLSERLRDLETSDDHR